MSQKDRIAAPDAEDIKKEDYKAVPFFVYLSFRSSLSQRLINSSGQRLQPGSHIGSQVNPQGAAASGFQNR